MLVHSVFDKPVDDEFLDLAKKNGAIYCPTLTVYRGYLRMNTGAAQHRAPEIDDPNSCVDPLTRARVAETAQVTAPVPADRLQRLEARVQDGERIGAANLKRVLDAGIPIAMGTDAGNPLTLHGTSVYAEMEAMQAAGLTPMQVLTASTRGGATAMGRAKDFGTVEKGKLADLLIVGADPTADIANLRKVRYVVREERCARSTRLKALATTPAEGEGKWKGDPPGPRPSAQMILSSAQMDSSSAHMGRRLRQMDLSPAQMGRCAPPPYGFVAAHMEE